MLKKQKWKPLLLSGRCCKICRWGCQSYFMMAFYPDNVVKIQYLDYVLSEDYKSFYIKLLFITLLLVFSIGRYFSIVCFPL